MIRSHIVGAIIGAAILIGGYAVVTGGGGGGPTFNVWVTTTGNDSTCVRGDSSKPCSTLNKAYSIANPGDNISVDAGTYASQPDVVQGSHTQSGPDMHFYCTSSGNVSAHSCTVSGDFNLGCSCASDGDPASESSPSHIILDGIDFKQGYFSIRDDTTAPDPTNITVENSHMWALNSSGPTNSVPAMLYIWGGTNVSILNNEIGPVCCDSDGIQVRQTTSLLVSGNYDHDIYGACAEVSSALISTYGSCTGHGFDDTSAPDCSNCEHIDGWQSYGGVDLTVRGNRFMTAGAQPFFASTFHGHYAGTLTFENNMVGFDYTTRPAGTSCPGGCEGGAGVSFGNNGWCTDGSCDGNTNSANLVIRNNTVQGDLHIYVNGFTTASNMTVANNAMGDYGVLNTTGSDVGCSGTRFGGGSYTPTYEYNLIGTGTCGGTDAVGSATFVNATYPYDLHLSGSDTHAIDKVLTGTDYPATDFDGDTRPCGSHTDIGADEHC